MVNFKKITVLSLIFLFAESAYTQADSANKNPLSLSEALPIENSIGIGSSTKADETASTLIQMAKMQNAIDPSSVPYVEITHIQGEKINPFLVRVIQQLHFENIEVVFDLKSKTEFEKIIREVGSELHATKTTDSPATKNPLFAEYETQDPDTRPMIQKAFSAVQDRFRRLLGTPNGISFIKFITSKDKTTGERLWHIKNSPELLKLAVYTTLWGEFTFALFLKFGLKMDFLNPHFISTMVLFPFLCFPILWQKDLINKIRKQGVSVLFNPKAKENPLKIRENKVFYWIANLFEYLVNRVIITGSIGGFQGAITTQKLNIVQNSALCTWASTPAEYLTARCFQRADELTEKAENTNDKVKSKKFLNEAKKFRDRGILVQNMYWNVVFPFAANGGLLFSKIKNNISPALGFLSIPLQYSFHLIGITGVGVDIWRSRHELPLALQNISEIIGLSKPSVCPNLLTLKKKPKELNNG